MPIVEGKLQEVRFKQLIASDYDLFGLDEEGFVWKYYPKNNNGPATWMKLTSKGKDATTRLTENKTNA